MEKREVDNHPSIGAAPTPEPKYLRFEKEGGKMTVWIV